MRVQRKAAVIAGVLAVVTLAACSTGPITQSDTAGAGSGVVPAGWQVGLVGTQDQIQPIDGFCGSDPITVAYADGSGNNAWRKITKQLFEAEAAKCPNIQKVIYTDAQNNQQKAISDFNSLIAQKVNVIVTFADAGPALLPTIKKATAAGIKVVPIVSSPGGVPGVDYVDFVAEDITAYGSTLATWTIKAMNGKGNLVMLGGVPGSPYSQAVWDGVKQAVDQNPGVTLLNDTGPVVTNWTPDQTQQVVAGLITKYGQIDGIVSDYGGGAAGGIRAFVAAHQPLPAWSANDSNEFACLYYQYHPDQPSYQVATESSRNWVITAALHKGLAAHNGLLNTEPAIYNLQIIEDSTDATKMPRCEKSLPPDAILSSGLTVDQLTALFK